jgi:hypothetical protein
MNPLFTLAWLSVVFYVGCQGTRHAGVIKKSHIADAKTVVDQGMRSAFGSPVPFKMEKEAPQSFFDPPEHMIEVRFQTRVSKKSFNDCFKASEWRKTSVPLSMAALAPGFDYPTSERIATSYERTVGEWDYRIIRSWESEEILLIAVRSLDHWRYQANGLDY